MQQQNEQNQELEELPAGLVAELRRRERSVSLLTPDVDRDVLQQAEAQFSSRKASRNTRLAAPAWIATAASLVLAVYFVQPFQESTEEAPVADVMFNESVLEQESFELRSIAPAAERAASVNDFDASGDFDISDLLLMARGDAGRQYSQDEIDKFAMQLVSLN